MKQKTKLSLISSILTLLSVGSTLAQETKASIERKW